MAKQLSCNIAKSIDSIRVTVCNIFLPTDCVCLISPSRPFHSCACETRTSISPVLPLAPFTMVVYWLCLAILAGNALASGVLKAKEQVQHPRFWLKRDRAPASHNLDLKIGLPQPSFHILERHLYEVSDPDHERYGQYLAKQDVEKLVAPHDTSVDAVDAWLLSHGIDTAQVDRSPAQDWVTITVPVFKAEAMLGTVRVSSFTLPTLAHAETNDTGVLCLDPCRKWRDCDTDAWVQLARRSLRPC